LGKKKLKALEKRLTKRLLKLVEGLTTAPAPPAPVLVPPTPPGRTLADWLPLYERLLSERDYNVQTVKNRMANLRHVRRLWGAHGIAELRPHHISSGLREFLPIRSSTARRVLAEVREVYMEAIANGWAENSPAAHVRPPAHKIKRKRLDFETWTGMRKLADAGRQRWVVSMLLLAIVTGQRRADLAKMQFDDIRDGHLYIEQQKKAGKPHGARIALPLTLRLDAIGMTLADVVEHCRESAKPGGNLLRIAGGGKIEESSLSTRFNETIRGLLGREAHGDHEWPSLHEVRSLSARMYRAQGVDVQTLLGHKDAAMTAVYVDDRGLSAGEYKMLVAPQPQPA